MSNKTTHNSKGITDEQVIDCLERGLTYKQAADELGCTGRNIRKRRDKLVRRGLWKSSRDHNRIVPEGFAIKRRSQNYDELGNIRQEWLISEPDKEKQRQMMEEAVKAMSEEIPKHAPSKPPTNTLSDLLNCYVISDYHLGMMAWSEESGSDWDLKIAEETLIKWFEKAIRLAPESKTAIFCNLSDMLHWDGLEAVTPAHRHVLDADTRFQKVVRVCIRLFRQIMDMLLDKHEKVVMINVGGKS